MKFYKQTAFWNYVIKILALFGPSGGIGLAQWQDDPTWLTISGVALFLSAALAILMVDKNKNNIVDIFEKDK